MKASLTFIMAAGIGVGGISVSHPASAMPMSGLDPAVAKLSDTAKNVESVRWICGPYGCRWVPGWRRHWWGPRYGYWGPGYGYGHYRPWPRYGWYGGPYGYGPYGHGYW